MTGIPSHPSDHSLADVMPSLAASLGVDIRNPLGLPPARDAVLMLVDGLGAELIRHHAEDAPTLAAMTTRMISAGFPSTTATSLTSLAVGATCSQHGIMGYSFRLSPDDGGPATSFNPLRWSLDSARGPSAMDLYPPRELQTKASLLELLSDDGVEVNYVMRDVFRHSGLTQAAFRADGIHRPAISLAEIREQVMAAVGTPLTTRRFVYAYFGDLDMIGHIHGPGSPEWRESLREVDAFVADLASDLPPECALLLTADHGMVSAETVIDLDSHNSLATDVEVIAGEARVRHVYARLGAEADVLAAWQAELTGLARVISREQALDEELFGVGRTYADRIGDVVAIATGGVVLTRPSNEPMESGLRGHHGANTAAEQHIPLIVR